MTRCVLDVSHFVALVVFGVIFWPAWSDRYFDTRGVREEFDSLLDGRINNEDGYGGRKSRHLSPLRAEEQDWGL